MSNNSGRGELFGSLESRRFAGEVRVACNSALRIRGIRLFQYDLLLDGNDGDAVERVPTNDWSIYTRRA